MDRKRRGRALRVFYSYCHKDSRHRKRLSEHLSLLRRENLISDWYDGMIGAGCEIDDEIRANLARADLILLLISHAFIDSGYCWEKEMREAVKRHRKGSARVIPVIVSPVEEGWQTTLFGGLKALPADGKPVTKWSNRDSAWADVANGIRIAIMEMSEGLAMRAAGGRSVGKRKR